MLLNGTKLTPEVLELHLLLLFIVKFIFIDPFIVYVSFAGFNPYQSVRVNRGCEVGAGLHDQQRSGPLPRGIRHADAM